MKKRLTMEQLEDLMIDYIHNTQESPMVSKGKLSEKFKAYLRNEHYLLPKSKKLKDVL